MVNLRELLSHIAGPKAHEKVPDMQITGVFDRVQDVIAGSVFVAVAGAKADGHDFLSEAVARNAAVLVVSNAAKVPVNFTGYVLTVENTRKTLGFLASRYFGNPSHHFYAVGVTGTNGKTSLTFLIEHLLNECGFLTGVIGTVNHHLEKRVWPASLTTPSPLELHHRLKDFKDEGATALAMEVSSHAIDQYRVDGVSFNCAVFTNLSHDHMEYHGNMESYFAAKERLFGELLWQSGKHPLYAIINQDDEWGKKIRVADSATVWTYGREPSHFRFQIKKSDFEGTEFTLEVQGKTHEVYTPLIGLYNVYNTVAAMAVAEAAGMDRNKIIYSLESFRGIPGRLQRVPNEMGLHLYVDYAHTPDALENVLKALNKIRDEMKAKNKIWTVFGCGGDRDKTKRPMMGKVAVENSDYVIITSDNPRNEDPVTIINDIKLGIDTQSMIKTHVQVNRTLAFEWLLSQVKPGDIALVAGKGHEDYQIIGEVKTHFSDFECLKNMMS